MRIKIVRVEEAIGKKIAYDTTSSTPDFKGAIIKKGKIIDKSDIEILKNNGHYFIYVYDDNELGDEEEVIHEEDAVINLAETLKGDNVKAILKDEGKAILVSTTKGLLIVNTRLLDDINVHSVFAVITKRKGSIVCENEIIGIVDLIPFTIQKNVLEYFLNIAKEKGPLLTVKRFVKTKIGLVVTGTEIYEGRKKDLAEEIIKSKATTYEAEIINKVIVPDNPDDIKRAILNIIDNCDCIIVTGGMSVDPNDYTPMVISSISDEVITYGIPVKPNTMTMVAYRDNKPIIGVSGGLIHYPNYNILDILLPWIASRTKITKDFLLSLAHGGLNEYYLSKYKNQ